MSLNGVEYRPMRVVRKVREKPRVATSKGSNKQKPPEQEDNFYECLEEMEEDDEDEEMESDPRPIPGNCDICQAILRDQRNRRRLEQNDNKKTAREEPRGRRQTTKERIAKVLKKPVGDVKLYTKSNRDAAFAKLRVEAEERTIQPRRLSRLNPIGADQ